MEQNLVLPAVPADQIKTTLRLQTIGVAIMTIGLLVFFSTVKLERVQTIGVAIGFVTADMLAAQDEPLTLSPEKNELSVIQRIWIAKKRLKELPSQEAKLELRNVIQEAVFAYQKHAEIKVKAFTVALYMFAGMIFGLGAFFFLEGTNPAKKGSIRPTLVLFGSIIGMIAIGNWFV